LEWVLGYLRCGFGFCRCYMPISSVTSLGWALGSQRYGCEFCLCRRLCIPLRRSRISFYICHYFAWAIEETQAPICILGFVCKYDFDTTFNHCCSKPRTVEEVLAIDVKPGWKKGTKITFPEKGNQEPGLLPGDLIFVIDEKPHSTFKRDGNDLLIHQKLSLLEALTGKVLNLNTLDGRTLTIEVSDIVKPGHEILIPDEGMPISKEPKKRGNLRIKFDIKFPSRLSSDQKSDLRRVLGATS